MPLEYRRVFQASAFIYWSNMYSCTQTLYHRTGACFILCQLFQASDGMPPPHCTVSVLKNDSYPWWLSLYSIKPSKTSNLSFPFVPKTSPDPSVKSVGEPDQPAKLKLTGVEKWNLIICRPWGSKLRPEEIRFLWQTYHLSWSRRPKYCIYLVFQLKLYWWWCSPKSWV